MGSSGGKASCVVESVECSSIEVRFCQRTTSSIGHVEAGNDWQMHQQV